MQNNFFWQETAMFNAWYEVLSVLHLMAMLLLSQANLLLLPRTSADGYQPKVSEGRLLREREEILMLISLGRLLLLFFILLLQTFCFSRVKG